MSKRDLQIFRVAEEYREGRLSLDEAALKLEVSPKTVSRKVKAIREKGIEGLVHGNRGRSPANKKDEQTRQWYVSLYRKSYYDCNFMHAFELIAERHSPPETVSYDVFRGWLRAEGLGKTKKRRASKARIQRERHANEGLMVQLDGSPHRYNGQDEWTLINVIDDATSKLLEAQFHPSETTFACMNVMRRVFEQHGIPEFVLTDQAGWSARIGKRAHFSQFERAMKELGVIVIPTSSAPSKGRVERSFRTSQDRLVPELRIEGIKTMETANRYLTQIFKPKWNEKFAVEARETTTRFKPVPGHIDLDEVFCLKHTRLVNRDHTVHFDADRYKLTEPPKNLWKHEVTIHQYKSGAIKIFYGADELRYEAIIQPKRRARQVG